MSDSLSPRQGVENLTPYRPGTPAEHIRRRYNLETVHKLASNENLAGVPKQVQDEISRVLAGINYYPDGDVSELREELAALLGVQGTQLVFGCGSDELILYLCLTFLEPGKEIIQSWPAFVRYRQNAVIAGGGVKTVPLLNWKHNLDAILAEIDENTALIFIDNPINPVGTYSSRKDWDRFIHNVPENVLVVLDQAYFEFVKEPDYPDGMEYVRDFPNLVVLRTFSKGYALAGLRTGYAVTSLQVADWVNRVRCPFNVNSLAQTAALAAIRCRESYREGIDKVVQERKRMESRLTKLGIEVIPSVTNFLLMEIGRDSLEGYESLCKRGIIVRPMKGLPGLDNWVRVTVSPEPEVNDLFLSEVARLKEESR